MLKIDSILYRAQNLELSPYPVYLFGTAYFDNVSLENFESVLRDLLTSSLTLTAKGSQIK